MFKKLIIAFLLLSIFNFSIVKAGASPKMNPFQTIALTAIAAVVYPFQKISQALNRSKYDRYRSNLINMLEKPDSRLDDCETLFSRRDLDKDQQFIQFKCKEYFYNQGDVNICKNVAELETNCYDLKFRNQICENKLIEIVNQPYIYSRLYFTDKCYSPQDYNQISCSFIDKKLIKFGENKLDLKYNDLGKALFTKTDSALNYMHIEIDKSDCLKLTDFRLTQHCQDRFTEVK
jgi:hypothetical protein